MTQRDKILRHLNDTGWITQLEAMRQYGIMRLASRIDELRKQGVAIKTTMVTQHNRYGEKVTYAKYTLD